MSDSKSKLPSAKVRAFLLTWSPSLLYWLLLLSPPGGRPFLFTAAFMSSSPTSSAGILFRRDSTSCEDRNIKISICFKKCHEDVVKA